MRSAHFAALVERQPDNELFRFSLAQALLTENKPAEAIEHLAICCTRKADWMMPRILLGKALVGLGRKTAAKPWLEQALQLAIAQNHDDPAQELQAILRDL